TESIAVEDDHDSLRQALWLATDQSYKQALKGYLEKQGKKVSEMEKEKAPDFSQEVPYRTVCPQTADLLDFSDYKLVLKNVSAEFKHFTEILDSGISLRSNQRAQYLLNSEGTQILCPASGNPYFIYVWAKSRSPDGMTLEVARTYSFRSKSNLPAESSLIQSVREMAEELLHLRKAKLADPYTAPAILDPDSTGVLFHEALGHRLEGERQRDEEEGQTFKGQVGKRVIPSFLSVEDDPTLATHNGVDLNGRYSFDEEGVPAQRVVLVENGILKNYLLSRRPIPQFLKSNGHGRAQIGKDPIGRMSNLIIKSSQPLPLPDLKKMLLEECKKQNKPYGLLIRKIRSGDTFTGRSRYQAFKGTPEQVFLVDAQSGEEVLVRGVEIVGTPLITVNKILATGNDVEVNNAFCGAESGTIPVSTIAPSALVKEVELQRLGEDRQKPPILPPPILDKE
ncbi:MAG: TldD/PmbA family protein, partial [Elusimicrobia bacterium]|nr:TldD/PmbA family protein [Elusimicrobiota bacterium]